LVVGEVLRDAGMRVTESRIRLLLILQNAKLPMRVSDIKLKIGKTNMVTLYRNLETLFRAGIVDRLDFGEDVASYELRHPGEDHHHVTCVVCKKRVNVHACVPEVVSRAKREAKGFASINRHSLEFFGTCVDCAKRKRFASNRGKKSR
jgi:Fur family ferric uptake transcriptional regulator